MRRSWRTFKSTIENRRRRYPITDNTLLSYRMEHIFSFTATLQNPPEVIGLVPEGIRVNAYVTGGNVWGPKVQGKVHPVGGDWLTIRTDGVGMVDVRITLETHDQALIYMYYNGVLDYGESGYDKVLRQELPPTIPVRIAPRFHTAHPSYQWLNRLQCVGIGQLNSQQLEVRYDVYAVT